ncbi:DivIVA domain-containing protein [Propionibacteriaceae bacterium G57]|uniref:DivIVA domain-containing protein n=1 Tax=Aestuariimicrobium sp. G57 TaxID=3418485 RepID=UPI003DA72565
MMWLLGVIAVAIIATGVFLASDKFGSMPELVEDQPVPRLPEGDFTAQDVHELRFAQVLRGYAPHQVDEVLDRVAAHLDGTSLARPVTGADLQQASFSVVGRGYHMAQVDLVIDRLAWQLDRPPALTGAVEPDAE